MKEALDRLPRKGFIVTASLLLLIMATGFIVQGPTQMGGQASQASGLSGAGDTVAFDSPQRAEAEGYTSGSSSSSPMYAINYNIDVRASNVREAMTSTTDRATDLGGRVESERFDRRYGVEGDLNLLIPKSKASDFISEIESGYRVESIDRSKRDVSDSYTQTSLELENRRQELDRLESLMNQTEEVDSLIDIQERMSDLRSRIQYLEQEKEGIEEDVEYVDVSISFEKPGAIESSFDIRESVADAYNGIFQSFNLLIVGTGYLIPFGLLAAVIYGLKRIYSEQFS